MTKKTEKYNKGKKKNIRKNEGKKSTEKIQLIIFPSEKKRK